MVNIFITKTKKELQDKCKAGELVFMTVYNLSYDDKEDDHMVTISEFSLDEVETELDNSEIVKNLLLGMEWESTQSGRQNKCTIFGKSVQRKSGETGLYLQIKTGEQVFGEFIFFEEKGMFVNENGQLEVEYNEIFFTGTLN